MPSRRAFRPLRRITRLILRALLVALLVLLGYESWVFGQVLWWRSHDPELTAFMAQDLERLRKEDPRARLKHSWVDYRQISPQLKRALIAAEDARFLEHQGFDWDGIQDAFEKNLRKGRIVAGGSTISQQLAKNLFLTRDRSYLRKAQEALITLMIEAAMDKRRILEIYLNVIEWGDGLYGAEAAARHYFGKRAAELDDWEAAQLAAMVPRPRHYQSRRDSPQLLRRAWTIYGYMPMVAVP